MARIFRFSIALLLVLSCSVGIASAQISMQFSALEALGESAFAQADVKPLMTVMVASTDEVLKDLKFILGEGKSENKAYGKLEETLDVFVVGGDSKAPAMDRQKPSGAVIFLEKSKLKTIFFVPVKNVAQFFDTIFDIGVEAKKEDGDFYKISNMFDGYARLSGGYVYFAESKEELLRKLPAPEELFKDFLAKKYDIAVRIDGESVPMADRREAFVEFHREMLAAVKQMKEESEVDFEIRKASTEFLLDETKRFFAESKNIELGWSTDVPEKVAKVHVELEALPETSLAKTIAVLEQTDGQANAAPPTGHISFGSSHFVFDEMRQKHLQTMLTLLRKKMHGKITSDEKLADADKKNAGQVADVIFDLLDANTRTGSLKGWLKVMKDSGGMHTLTGQMTVTDAAEVVAILKSSGVAEMNVGTDPGGNAEIHRVKLPGKNDGLKKQFGDDISLYFATGKNALKNRIWIGMGHDAVDALKKAIAANEAESPVAIRLRVDVGSWIDALIDPEKKKPEEKPKKGRKRRRGRKSKRSKVKRQGTDVGRIAWQTLGTATDDVLVFSLEKVGENRVSINELIDTGLLRFLGKVLTKEINANL